LACWLRVNDPAVLSPAGASQLDRTICSEGRRRGLEAGLREEAGDAGRKDFRLARLILAWARISTQQRATFGPWWSGRAAQRARLIVIDPYSHRTAALADWHIAIRPGTDGRWRWAYACDF